VLSLLPPSAPMVTIAGDVPAWQVAASVVVTVADAAALVTRAARVYAAAVLRTGSRVSLRAAWRSAG
jgi:ABC-2 type transport system permease protein